MDQRLQYLTPEVNRILSEATINVSELYSEQTDQPIQLVLSEAIKLVPEKSRTLGKIISFLNKEEEPQIEVYIFDSNTIQDWEDLDHWKPIAIGAQVPDMKIIGKYHPYLYEVAFSELDYYYAKEKLMDAPVCPGGCTTVVSGNFVGRNFDWKFDNSVEFIVRSENVLGIAGCIPGLTKDVVASQNWVKKDIHKLIPFYLQDGVNAHGLFASVHVVNNEFGVTKKSIPFGSVEEEIPAVMLVRYILDNFTKAEEAVHYIRNSVSVIMPNSLLAQGYELQFMVADKNSAFNLQFILGYSVLTENLILCNFYWNNVTLNEDGKLYTPYTKPEGVLITRANGLGYYAQGVERYNIAKSNLPITRLGDMQDLMQEFLLYSNAYKHLPVDESAWNTEFVKNNLTIESSLARFQELYPIVEEAWENRDRETAKVWHTKHSCVYDLESLSIRMDTQDGDYGLPGSKNIWVDFSNPGDYYTKADVDRKLDTLKYDLDLVFSKYDTPTENLTIRDDINDLGPGAYKFTKEVAQVLRLPMVYTGGILEEYNLDDPSHKRQIVRYSDGSTYHRYNNGSGWSTWDFLPHTEIIQLFGQDEEEDLRYLWERLTYAHEHNTRIMVIKPEWDDDLPTIYSDCRKDPDGKEEFRLEGIGHSRAFRPNGTLHPSGSGIRRMSSILRKTSGGYHYLEVVDIGTVADIFKVENFLPKQGQSAADVSVPPVGLYTYDGHLCHSRSIVHNNESWLLICCEHAGTAGNIGSTYVTYKAGRYDNLYNSSTVPDWVKRAFNEATATNTYPGLMSAAQCKKLADLEARVKALEDAQ